MKKERVQKILDRMERGQYTGFTIEHIVDKITWLWKWRKITHDELTKMTSQVMRILGEDEPSQGV